MSRFWIQWEEWQPHVSVAREEFFNVLYDPDLKPHHMRVLGDLELTGYVLGKNLEVTGKLTILGETR